MKWIFFIQVLALLSCSALREDKSSRTLVGQWQVEKIISPDSSEYEGYPEYNSSHSLVTGSLFFRANELNSMIMLGTNGQLETTLVFANFGTPTWITNNNMDSLIFKLTQVDEPSLIADGIVDKNGDLYLYEGAIKFIDEENVDWTLSDGRIFKLKKKISR